MKPILRSTRPSACPGQSIAGQPPGTGAAGGSPAPVGPSGQVGLSLLQGLLVLAIIGLVAAFLLNQLR